MWWVWMLAGIGAFFTIFFVIGLPIVGIGAARALRERIREQKEPQGKDPAEEINQGK